MRQCFPPPALYVGACAIAWERWGEKIWTCGPSGIAQHLLTTAGRNGSKFPCSPPPHVTLCQFTLSSRCHYQPGQSCPNGQQNSRLHLPLLTVCYLVSKLADYQHLYLPIPQSPDLPSCLQHCISSCSQFSPRNREKIPKSRTGFLFLKMIAFRTCLRSRESVWWTCKRMKWRKIATDNTKLGCTSATEPSNQKPAVTTRLCGPACSVWEACRVPKAKNLLTDETWRHT